MKLWHVFAIRTESLTRSRQVFVRDGKRFTVRDQVEFDKAPVKVELVIQDCDSADYAKRMATAYFGTVRHDIISVTEITTPLQVLLAWKAGAIIF